jgi:anti-sigma regulatory factor (Ser/Thr protein kinase)
VALDRAEGQELGGDEWAVRARIPRDRSCSTVARRLLEGYVREGLNDPAGEDVLLIASELVTNAFVHGEGTIKSC